MRVSQLAILLGAVTTVTTLPGAAAGPGKPVDVDGTMTFRCAFGNSCPDGDAMVSDGASYQDDAAQDTFVYLSKEGRLQFRLSNETGTRSLFLNLTGGDPLCTSGPHCYAHPGIPGWAETFGRDGGQGTVVNASGSDVKNGLNSLAVGAETNGRFVVNWDDPGGADMRWGLTFRGADQSVRIRRDSRCTWTIYAPGGDATAVLSAWPKIKRAYTEVPQATYDVTFGLTFSTCVS